MMVFGMHLVEQRGDAVIIHVQENLDKVSASRLASAIELAEVNQRQRIVVCLELCKSCDSAGLSVLARAHKRNGSYFFVVLPDGAPCRRTFGVTGLSTLIQLVPTLQGALDVKLTA
jgi:anti-anti-sigma factor